MWRILLGMISTASLAAFSAALSPTLGLNRATQVAAASARATPVPGSSTGAAPAGGVSPPVLRPGQVLPRGSLLNLCV